MKEMMVLKNESSLDFIITKFDKCEKDKKEKEKKSTLKDNLADATDKIVSLERQIDKSEQYSGQTCILLHGIQESKGI